MIRSIAILSIFFCFITSAVDAQTQGWVQLNSGTTAGFNYISLVGRDTVYVSGNGAMLRSTDGGISWSSLVNIPSYKGVQMRAALVQFIDSITGFLCGSADTLYKTIDGGQTWFANSSTGLVGGSIPQAMTFKDRNNGWLLGSNSSGYSRTTDGGVTWQSGSIFGGLNCMVFADTKHGYVMGKTTAWLPDPRKPPSPAFERTTNGGASWSLVLYTGPYVTRDIWAMTALTIDTLFAVGDHIIAKSIDTGNTWDTLPALTSTEHYQGINFFDHLQGTIVGSSGIIIHTTDGGLTWSRQNSGITDGSYLYAVSFVDSLIGYAVGDNGIILKTTNGGLSWVRVSPPSNNLIQARVYPLPANNTASLSYTLPQAQHVSITLQDITGKTVSNILDGEMQAAGPHVVTFDVSRLPAGTYFLQLRGENVICSGKLIVEHDAQ